MPDTTDIDAVADAVLERLDPGTVIDNTIILSKRQLLAIAGSGLGAGGLAALGISEASAQTGPAGQVGTDTEPVDVEAWDLDVANLINGSGVLSEGDGTERQVRIIANGADDPDGADPEDIIFEEES